MAKDTLLDMMRGTQRDLEIGAEGQRIIDELRDQFGDDVLIPAHELRAVGGHLYASIGDMFLAGVDADTRAQIRRSMSQMMEYAYRLGLRDAAQYWADVASEADGGARG